MVEIHTLPPATRSDAAPPPDAPTPGAPTPETVAALARQQARLERMADLLLALETRPMRDFRLHPLAVRALGERMARPLVGVDLDGSRWRLDAAEARTVALCLRQDRAFRGASVIAAAIETALDEARDAARLLGPGR